MAKYFEAIYSSITYGDVKRERDEKGCIVNYLLAQIVQIQLFLWLRIPNCDMNGILDLTLSVHISETWASIWCDSNNSIMYMWPMWLVVLINQISTKNADQSSTPK